MKSVHMLALLASAAAAAPSRVLQPAEIPQSLAQIEAQFNPAPVPKWTVESLKRTCAADDSSCTWHFFIDNHVASKATEITYVVEGPGASRAKSGPSEFGNYTITSSWSDQFGADKGFTALSAIDRKAGLISFPAYRDVDVKEGKVVADKDFDVYYLDSK
ncbi:uncharacterized protein UV8b_05233 [Ustilaginoidea virens]|uniref:Uncharacterized protein n=1 Tax=Ustilaginoidea virens TaxID=1159556 RepID=A0A063C3Q1_USTVR|nr:uncharacterized protein UV8b_05233 [Ustilaginoidea virens]QUC20992.1 hypothetical protein UV8b_05233 [Ustilaginoidea virens]GAO19333.1 hypothetical protein UVI_02008630 [Ustilaginoidea virens]